MVALTEVLKLVSRCCPRGGAQHSASLSAGQMLLSLMGLPGPSSLVSAPCDLGHQFILYHVMLLRRGNWGTGQKKGSGAVALTGILRNFSSGPGRDDLRRNSGGPLPPVGERSVGRAAASALCTRIRVWTVKMMKGRDRLMGLGCFLKDLC